MAKSQTSKARKARSALLILDMISEFDFPDGPQLVPPALRAAQHIARLKQRARRARSPIIYVNDTPGVWESNPREHVRRCSAPSARGRKIVELIAPTDDDYFMFKPRHSAFFETSLNSLLAKLQVKRLTLTGTTAHQCVLFTAMDAHIRGYEIVVPRSCVASPKLTQTRHALAILADSVEASIV
jgi:nicotinamidase-related amidase